MTLHRAEEVLVVLSWRHLNRNWLAGWLVDFYPSEKYEFVSWDDELPNISGKIKHVCGDPGKTIEKP